MNSSHKWARLFSQIGLNRTFLKQSGILWRCPTKVGDIAKLGTLLFSDFNGGSWYGVSPVKCLKYYMDLTPTGGYKLKLVGVYT